MKSDNNTYTAILIFNLIKISAAFNRKTERWSQTQAGQLWKVAQRRGRIWL